MKLPKAYLKFIEEIFTLVKYKALLPEYAITVKHVKSLKDKRYPNGYSAEVVIDTRYLQVDVSITGKIYQLWKEKKFKEIVEILAHEVSHIYTDPYYELFEHVLPKNMIKQLEHINEQQTERISKLIMLNIRPEEYLK